MNDTKSEFIKSFLPNTVENIDMTQINLDITDLSIGDICRNINKIYPENSVKRNLIKDGRLVVGVLCKSELLDPYLGIFILFGSKDMIVDVTSCNYIVLCISEELIRSSKSIMGLTDGITDHMIKNHSDILTAFKDFYRKFLYNEDEMHSYTPVDY